MVGNEAVHSSKTMVKLLSYHTVSSQGAVIFSHCYLKSWSVPAVISLWEIILLEVSIRCRLAFRLTSLLHLQSPFPSWNLGQDCYLGPVPSNANMAWKLLQQFSITVWWSITLGLETEMPTEKSMEKFDNLHLYLWSTDNPHINSLSHITALEGHWNIDFTEYACYESETLWRDSLIE